MARRTANFRLNGGPAVVALVVILGLVGYRVVTLGETDDPVLEEAVRAELMIRQSQRTGQELDRLDDADIDEAAVRSLAARADPEGIEVHSLGKSAPLLDGSGGDVVVRVEYSLPGGPRVEEYWVFEHPSPRVWRYRRQTSELWYWLNLI